MTPTDDLEEKVRPRMAGCECPEPHFDDEVTVAGRLLAVLRRHPLTRADELDAIATFVRAWLDLRGPTPSFLHEKAGS